MFKVAEEPTFRHKVTARVPVDGGFEEQSFEATFRTIPLEEAEAFDLMSAEGATPFFKRAIVELHDIGGADGNPVEYSDKVRDAVLALPWARKALAKAYFGAMAGAKEGN